MIIVADASPLHYLVLIEQITVLPLLYGQVIVPTSHAPSCSQLLHILNEIGAIGHLSFPKIRTC
jgi:hypothetical protein